MSRPQVQDPVRRGRRQLLAVAAIFFVPLFIAFWLYFGADHWRPAGATNQGEIIDPARPLPAVSLEKSDGTQTGEQFLRGKWSMLYIGSGACGPECRKALFLTRQSRIALNKDMDRLQRVFLVTQRCCDNRYLAAEHPDLLVAKVGQPDRRPIAAGISRVRGRARCSRPHLPGRPARQPDDELSARRRPTRRC